MKDARSKNSRLHARGREKNRFSPIKFCSGRLCCARFDRRGLGREEQALRRKGRPGRSSFSPWKKDAINGPAMIQIFGQLMAAWVG